MTIYTAVIMLILVMDPLGNIPVFLSVLHHVPRAKRKAIILRETFIAFIVLTGFLLFGQYIMQWMYISDYALSVAGGIILFLIAIRMIFPTDEANRTKIHGEPFIVPLAVPLVAGPSCMALVMLLANQAPNHLWRWELALFLAWFISTIILVFADNLSRLLGERGITAIERLMGMILTTMAVQMFLTGIEKFMHAQG